MSKERDSKKRIALIQRYSEGSVAPEMIQVVPTGTWDHPMYGEMVIDSAAISAARRDALMGSGRGTFQKVSPTPAARRTGNGSIY
jgi:hypothetical protein